jgi:hypothetical protein
VTTTFLRSRVDDETYASADSYQASACSDQSSLSVVYVFNRYSIGYVMLFLTDVCGLPAKSAGYVPTGFYVGSLLAHLILPRPTHTWLSGEHWMLTIDIIVILAL